MLVKNIILGNNENFINYLFEKCDIFSLTKYQEQHKEETTVTFCYNHKPLSNTDLTMVPITFNTNSDVFIGINFDVNLFIFNGHLKIGWDIPSTKIQSMPGTNASNFNVYWDYDK